MTKVSIIIPVYNGEAYLEECISSALSQTLRETEVICVDDGSTDSTPLILQRMAAGDPRVVCLHQENRGAGTARNLGIRQARGRYVCFLDADDCYPDKDALRVMYEGCEREQASVCACARMQVLDSVGRVSCRGLFPAEAAGRTVPYRDFQTDDFYQSYLFGRELLLENGISFPPYLRYQDPPFLVRAAHTAGSLLVLDACLYRYREPDMEARFNAVKAADMLRGILDNLLYAGRHHLDILFHNTAERLETTYAYILCRYATADNPEVSGLLREVNRVICRGYGDEGYVIKPLRMQKFCAERYGRELLCRIRSEESVALYGAGKLTGAFLHYLEGNGLLHKVGNIVVSDTTENPSRMEGIPVISLGTYLRGKETFLLVTVGRAYAGEIRDALKAGGCSHFDVLDDIFGDILLKENFPSD